MTDQHIVPADESERTRTRGPYLSLLAADGISQTGSALTFLAIPWFVLETTGSAARTGLTAAVEAVAVVVAGFLGGALVDRIGHKRTSVVSDLISAVGYGKGSQVLAMLEDLLGTATMMRCVRAFYENHPRGEAGSWEEFAAAVRLGLNDARVRRYLEAAVREAEAAEVARRAPL